MFLGSKWMIHPLRISAIMISVFSNEMISGMIPEDTQEIPELSGTPYIPTSRVSTVDDLADSRLKRGTQW